MTDKIAIVTGSSSGIGLLTAIELAKNGFKVVASMRDPERRTRLDEAVAAAEISGQLDIRRLDVTDFHAMPGFVQQVVGDYGRIDVLINNAGFAVAGFAEDMKLDEIRLQFETNFFGQVALTQAVLPTMRRQRSGHIIMVSSISGLHGALSVSSYSASKFALEGWSESLRLEMSSDRAEHFGRKLTQSCARGKNEGSDPENTKTRSCRSRAPDRSYRTES